MIQTPIWVLVTMGVAIVLLGLMLWTNLRERQFKVKVPDIDDKMGIRQNYLYRVTAGLERQKLVRRRDGGFHAA